MPLYMGELIRMLIDRGGLKQETPNEDWQVTAQALELIAAIPGTIKDFDSVAI